jgi:hypothetical protein
LSILAIAEAWDVLGKVLYYKRKEDHPDIMNQVQVAANLLAKAKEKSSIEVVNNLKPKAEYAEENLLKVMYFARSVVVISGILFTMERIFILIT